MVSSTTPLSPEVARDRAQQRVKNSAAWFYWIAAMSLLNSVMVLKHARVSFPIGLGITQVFDGVGRALGGNGPLIAVVVDVIPVACFVLLGYVARRYPSAFVIGGVLYALDALLLLIGPDYLGISFHVIVLLGIFGGFRAARQARPTSPDAKTRELGWAFLAVGALGLAVDIAVVVLGSLVVLKVLALISALFSAGFLFVGFRLGALIESSAKRIIQFTQYSAIFATLGVMIMCSVLVLAPMGSPLNSDRQIMLYGGSSGLYLFVMWQIAIRLSSAVKQAAPLPAGWHQDPFGRHAFRYWDGSSWTHHVADGGQAAVETAVERSAG